MTEPAQYAAGLTDAERDLARVDSHMRECDWPKVADCTECGYRLGKIRLQLKALAEAGWLDPTVAQALRTERDEALAAMERAVEERNRMERVAAEKTAAEFERNHLRPVAEVAKAWALAVFGGGDLKLIEGDEDHYSSVELALLAAVDEWQRAQTETPKPKLVTSKFPRIPGRDTVAADACPVCGGENDSPWGPCAEHAPYPQTAADDG
jgi:hypothetical protein